MAPMSLSRLFESWSLSATERLRCYSRTAASYAETQGNLAHYRAVASSLLTTFGDLELAQAAFLHGIDPDDIDVLDEIPDLPPAVRNLLDERNRLRSIVAGTASSAIRAEEGAELARLLTDNVLPRI